jgi:hypothetical protein
MILAIPEYDSQPASPAQWDRYYDTALDGVYIQTLGTADPGYPNWEEIEKGAAIRDSMRVGTGEASLVRSKYSGKDYQTYKDQIVAWLSLKYGDSFNDFMSSSASVMLVEYISVMLVEYISAAFDQMSFYMDRYTDEWYPSLARLASSAALLCRYLGYKAGGAVSGSTSLDITLTNGPYAFDVTIYKGHKVEGPNGLIFEVDSNQVIPNSLVPADHFLAVGYVTVKVGGVTWTEAEFLPYSDSTEFEVDYLVDPPRLRFGDGIIGSIPAQNSEIRVSYIATAGKKSSLAIVGTITKNITPVVVNFSTIPITVSNPVGVTGGADPETTASISANAPRWYDTADRVVTKRDMETLAGGFVDSLYGSIAKANALSIRSVDQDLQLQSMLNDLVGDTTDLTTNLTGITTQLSAIKNACGPSTTTGTIQAVVNDITTNTMNQILVETANITSEISLASAASDEIDVELTTGQALLDFMPFRELIGQGDGSTTVFSGIQLSMVPLSVSSVSVMVLEEAPLKDSTDGDCDANPGKLFSSSIGFVSDDVSRTVRIGGEYRQILIRESATTIQYSGPRIYGTSLIVEVFDKPIIGFSDSAGVISGTGISGSVDEAGVLSVTFTVAPTGLSGKYGVPIVASYQYKADSIKTQFDEITTKNLTVKSWLSSMTDTNEDISTLVNGSAVDLTTLVTISQSIISDAEQADVYVSNSLNIPVQMSNRVDDLETHLDTVISGECKANIVRISCLVYDSDGFYAAPSVSLIKALKAYMDSRRIETVRISVVDGSYYLLKANMSVQIKIKEQYVFSSVSALVLTAIDTILKDRDGGEGLKRSQYNQSLQDIEGVDYLNVNITSTTWYHSSNDETPPTIDSDGNLFVDEHIVITKGTITPTELF